MQLFAALAVKNRLIQTLQLLKTEAKNLGSCLNLKMNTSSMTSCNDSQSVRWTAASQTVAGGRLLASLRGCWLAAVALASCLSCLSFDRGSGDSFCFGASN